MLMIYIIGCIVAVLMVFADAGRSLRETTLKKDELGIRTLMFVFALLGCLLSWGAVIFIISYYTGNDDAS